MARKAEADPLSESVRPWLEGATIPPIDEVSQWLLGTRERTSSPALNVEPSIDARPMTCQGARRVRKYVTTAERLFTRGTVREITKIGD